VIPVLLLQSVLIKLLAGLVEKAVKDFLNQVKIGVITQNGFDITAVELPPINVSIVAPSGAGETSLLSTVMKDITGALPAGFEVRLIARGDIKKFKKDLDEVITSLRSLSTELDAISERAHTYPYFKELS